MSDSDNHLASRKSLSEDRKFCVVADAPNNEVTARVLDENLRKKIP
jgi:hypothetical protein